MTLDEATQIVEGMTGYFQHENGWHDACLDGWFTPEQLDAIAMVIRANQDPTDADSASGHQS